MDSCRKSPGYTRKYPFNSRDFPSNSSSVTTAQLQAHGAVGLQVLSLPLGFLPFRPLEELWVVEQGKGPQQRFFSEKQQLLMQKSSKGIPLLESSCQFCAQQGSRHRGNFKAVSPSSLSRQRIVKLKMCLSFLSSSSPTLS